MCAVPKNRADEVIARQIVAHGLLGATVVHHDDGSRPGMVDAVITYADGRTAALEVVTDTDPGYRRIRARLAKGGEVIDAPDLKFTWHITVSDDADNREIHRRVVFILGQMEYVPPRPELGWPDGRRWQDHETYENVFRWLGIVRATPNDTYGEAAKVIITSRSLWGFGGTPDDIPTWVVEFLSTTADDVPKKLVASGHEERHAFVWATITTDYSVLSVLDGDALPTSPPRLPPGVTHVWIGALYGGSRTLRWQPDDGWSEVYRIPHDGHVDLPMP